MTRPRRDPPREPTTPVSDECALVALVEETSDGVECTLVPADADSASLPTTWLTAAEDSFVDLADWR